MPPVVVAASAPVPGVEVGVDVSVALSVVGVALDVDSAVVSGAVSPPPPSFVDPP